MARYHPSEDWLVAYASGAIDEAMSVLLATHLTFCSACRDTVEKYEEIGGALLDEIDIECDAKTNGALPKSRHELKAKAPDAPALNAAPSPQGSLTEFAPQPLIQYVLNRYGTVDMDALPWTFYGPGIERVYLSDSPYGAGARMLRAQPGAKFPHHRHGSEELTVVLQGAYKDDTGRYDVGDVQCASEDASHQPVIEPGVECIALVVSEKPTIPTSLVAKIVQRFIGA